MPTFPASDGTRLSYRVEGRGAPLVCLPGGPMLPSSYLRDLGGLTAQRSLVLLDLRGTGDSEEPSDTGSYRVDRQVDDVEALRAALGLERLDVLAHSAAGDLALLYAARYPERISALVLVTSRARAVGIDFTPEHRREALELRSREPWYPEAVVAFDAVVEGTATDEQWELFSRLGFGRWDEAAAAFDAENEELGNDEAADAYPAPEAFADAAAVREVLAKLDAPVLVLSGELDGGPRPVVAAEVAAVFPRGEHVVQPATGHYPWIDDPAFFARTVAEFLDRHGR
ncbi:alpha/beta fold hydrolase [Streptacidiphilus rugosus]|uniref:alpha/beta fold hydrolase n=1 Tax=Streptacidiphilus rugosus TaxID=405783 RepID=UPI000561615A|nr:alpha/beta hydrolase [Streptacidiphilus rugosus]